MSVNDSISNYIIEESFYNKYISEFEELSKSKDNTAEKCKNLFNSCRTQLEKMAPALTAGAAPSPSQIEDVISFLKTELHRKTHQLAEQLVQLQVKELRNPISYQKFPYSLRLEIAKCSTGADFDYAIKNYGFNQDDIYELVKIEASSNPTNILMNIQDYKIVDEKKRFEIAKIILSGSHAHHLFLSYEDFNISNPDYAFELMKRLAPLNPKRALDYIKKLPIVDPDQLFHLKQIAEQAYYEMRYKNGMNDFYLYGDKSVITSVSLPDTQLKLPLSPTLRGWLDRAIALEIPMNMQAIEETQCREKINSLLSDLIEEGRAAGFSEDRLKSLSNQVIMKAESLQQRMKTLLWLGDFLIRCELEPALKPLLEDKAAASIFEAVFKLTNPVLQVAGTTALIEIYTNKDKRNAYLSLVEGRPKHLLLTTLLLTHRGIEVQASKKILDSLKAKRYSDYKLMQSINELICILAKTNKLSVPEQTRLLEVVLSDPEKGKLERAPAYQKRLEEHRMNQEVCFAAIPLLISFGRYDALRNNADTKTLIEKWNAESGIFGLQSTEEIKKFDSIFRQSKRYPNGLLIYASGLQQLREVEKEAMNRVLRQLIISVLDGTFPQIRYEVTKNPHLKTISESNPTLLEKWKKSLLPQFEIPEGLVVEDTDQWEDLMLLGNEMVDSCQDIASDSEKNKCLMAYILDGKNRAIVVKDKKGKIIARSVLRILWDPDKKKPVLFMEKIYRTKNQDASVVNALVVKLCEQKARFMNLPLVACHGDYLDSSSLYPGKLEALGGPVPFEYADAAGGAQAGGKFVIPETKVIVEAVGDIFL